jgi:TorA maturation chaperone TorD
MTQALTIEQIDEQLQRLPPDKLAVVLDFVSYLADHQPQTEVFETMLASEAVLSRDWLTPEEDAAWADL